MSIYKTNRYILELETRVGMEKSESCSLKKKEEKKEGRKRAGKGEKMKTQKTQRNRDR